MGTTERRERHRASLRREILDAASRLFVEEGYDRLTMRRLAARIEYSPTTIYLYFKDKNALMAAVCQETFAQLAGKLEHLTRSSAPPLGRLREGLRAYVEFGLANPDQYAATFQRRLSPGQAPGFDASAGAGTFQLLRQSVQACADSGDIRTTDVEMTTQALWASVHGVTSLFITTQGFPLAGRRALIDHTIDTLIAGLRPPAPRTPSQPQSRKWDFLD